MNVLHTVILAADKLFRHPTLGPVARGLLRHAALQMMQHLRKGGYITKHTGRVS